MLAQPPSSSCLSFSLGEEGRPAGLQPWVSLYIFGQITTTFPFQPTRALEMQVPRCADPRSGSLSFRLRAWHLDSGLPWAHPQLSLQATERKRQLSQPVGDLQPPQPPIPRPQAEQIFSITTAEFRHSREPCFLSPELIGRLGAQAQHLCLGPSSVTGKGETKPRVLQPGLRGPVRGSKPGLPASAIHTRPFPLPLSPFSP